MKVRKNGISIGKPSPNPNRSQTLRIGNMTGSVTVVRNVEKELTSNGRKLSIALTSINS